MELYKFEGKYVHIIDADGEEFTGRVGDYVWEDENEDFGCDAIILDNPTRGDGYQYENPVQFNSSDIVSIKVLE